MDLGERQAKIEVECKLKGDSLVGKGQLSVGGHEMEMDVKAQRTPKAGKGGAL
jgi:hypothetical protein